MQLRAEVLQPILVIKHWSRLLRRGLLGGLVLLIIGTVVYNNWLTKMPEQFERTCQACRQRLATRYDIYGHTGEVRALCTSCFERLAESEQLADSRQAERKLDGHLCHYCGAPAVQCSAPFETDEDPEDQITFWCAPCGQDLAEFGKRPENAVPDIDVADEAQLDEVTRLLAKRERRKQEFMRQRVKARTDQKERGLPE